MEGGLWGSVGGQTNSCRWHCCIAQGLSLPQSWVIWDCWEGVRLPLRDAFGELAVHSVISDAWSIDQDGIDPSHAPDSKREKKNMIWKCKNKLREISLEWVTYHLQSTPALFWIEDDYLSSLYICCSKHFKLTVLVRNRLFTDSPICTFCIRLLEPTSALQPAWASGWSCVQGRTSVPSGI